MKIITIKLVMLLIVMFSSSYIYSQNKKDFSVRFDTILNGKFTTIGNNILSKTATTPYDNRNELLDNSSLTNDNGNIEMVYVDIDDLDIDTNDKLSFNSSSANFDVATKECFKIGKVLLYWVAADFEASTITGSQKQNNVKNIETWKYNQVKLMLPGQSQYTLITADETIYRARDEEEHFAYDPYVCVKDITKEVTSVSSPFGKYQIANIKSASGLLQIDHNDRSPGLCGGWQIVFVYEYLDAPSQSITIFDGFTQILKDGSDPLNPKPVTETIDIKGFKTVPSGNVNASVLFGALDGEHSLTGDQLLIRKRDSNDFAEVGNTELRPNDNFFNSRITIDDQEFLTRNPASKNTLGFDAGIFKLDNPSNSIIGNGQENTTLKITTSADSYGLYLFGFSVENYQPDLSPILLSTSLNSVSSPIEITPGTTKTPVNYTLQFTNNGNDDAENVKLTTTLPNQVALTPPSLPTGITYTFNETTRVLDFIVDNSLMKSGASVKIDYNVEIADNCYFLVSDCSNLEFQSQFTATYIGKINKTAQTTTSSTKVGNCRKGDDLPLSFKIKPTAPFWVTKNLDTELSCDDEQGLINAQKLVPKANCDFNLKVTKSEFIPDNEDCTSTGKYVNTWTFKDKCALGNNLPPFTQTITIVDNEDPKLDDCSDKLTNLTLECGTKEDLQLIANKWHESNLKTIAGCAKDNCIDITTDNITSNYNFIASDKPICEQSDAETTIIYTISDGCGNAIKKALKITYDIDTTVPNLDDCSGKLNDLILDCNSQKDMQTLAEEWHANNLKTIQGCVKDNCIKITADNIKANFNFKATDKPICEVNGESETVTYKITDLCGNTLEKKLKIIYKDESAPQIGLCKGKLSNKTIECSGQDFNTLVNQWNQQNIATLKGCAKDLCNPEIPTKVIPSIVINKSCGNTGTATITYAAEDACGNRTTNDENITVTITVKDSLKPFLEKGTIQSVIKVQCNAIPDKPIVSFKDQCSLANVNVDYKEIAPDDNAQDEDFEITRIWTVSDECGNTEVFTQRVEVSSNTFMFNFNDSYCFDDGKIDLNDYISTQHNNYDNWEYVSGPINKIDFKDGVFDPSKIDIDSMGIFTFKHIEPNGYCYRDTNVKLDINDNCIVYPCNPDLFTISKTITPNGDQYNQYFTVIGSRECEFQIDLKIFNRWGAIIYENTDYKNDWDGLTSKSAIGSSKTVTNGTYYYVIKLIDSGFKPFSGAIYVGTK